MPPRDIGECRNKRVWIPTAASFDHQLSMTRLSHGSFSLLSYFFYFQNPMGVKIGSVDRWSLPLHQLSCSFYFERRASFYSVQPVARGIPGEMKTTAATTHASKSSGQQQQQTLSVCADLIKRTYSPRGIPFRSSLDVISSTVSKWNECVPDTMRYRCAIFNPRARGRKIHGNRVCCCYYLFPFFSSWNEGLDALLYFIRRLE